MSRVRSNIVANVAGQGWAVLLALACTPLYIRFLGVEAYGLLAFFLVLQSLVQLLDMGLAAAVNREVAGYSESTEAPPPSVVDFVATMERWYWTLGAAVAALLVVALPPFSGWWLRPQALPSEDLAWAARVFAVLALLQWPSLFYQSAIAGLQRQVVLNAIQMPFAFLSNVGGVILIWLGPRSIVALIAWQGAMVSLQLIVLYLYFRRHTRFTRTARTGPGLIAVLRERWRFSLGMTGINVTGLLLTHLDKLILSRLLPLQAFGYYSLASTVARALYIFISPVFGAYFPRLSALVAKGGGEPLKSCYHTATQVMAVFILPTASILVLFPRHLIEVWLHDATLAATIAPIAAWLVIGTCLNGLMNIPFALQLAHGKTGIGLTINLGLVTVLIPSIIYAATEYGALGGAFMWAATNLLYLLVGIPVTHKVLLQGESARWLLKDVLPPLVCAGGIVGAGFLLSNTQSQIGGLAMIVVLWMLATAASIAASTNVRRHVLSFSAS